MIGSALFIRQSTHGCGDIIVCDLLETREDTVGRREARCCGAGSRRTDIGDFLGVTELCRCVSLWQRQRWLAIESKLSGIFQPRESNG